MVEELCRRVARTKLCFQYVMTRISDAAREDFRIQIGIFIYFIDTDSAKISERLTQKFCLYNTYKSFVLFYFKQGKYYVI